MTCFRDSDARDCMRDIFSLLTVNVTREGIRADCAVKKGTLARADATLFFLGIGSPKTTHPEVSPHRGDEGGCCTRLDSKSIAVGGAGRETRTTGINNTALHLFVGSIYATRDGWIDATAAAQRASSTFSVRCVVIGAGRAR